MGTRSLTFVYEGGLQSQPVCCIYRQYDGYPKAHGADIKDCLGVKTLVNGFNDPTTQVNGMGCAAAMLIGHLKNGECGGIYMYPTDSSDVGEEFIYRLFEDEADKIGLIVERRDRMVIYRGSLNDFDPKEVDKLAYK